MGLEKSERGRSDDGEMGKETYLLLLLNSLQKYYFFYIYIFINL